MRSLILILSALLCAGHAIAQTPDGRLRKIIDSKTITIAHRIDAAPFSFINDSKEISGYSIDLCKRVVASIERQTGVKEIRIRYVPVTTQTRFDAIIKGQADIECGASTVTLTRMRTVDFSSFIFFETTGMLAKSGTGLNALADFKGKRIAAIGGTSNERALNMQLKRQQVSATVVPVKNSGEAIAALDAGTIDGFASDALLLIGAVTQARDPKSMTLLNEQLSFEPYGLVLPRGESSLRLAVNTALSQIYAGDEINDIYNRWFAGFGKPSALIEAVYIFGSIPE